MRPHRQFACDPVSPEDNADPDFAAFRAALSGVSRCVCCGGQPGIFAASPPERMDTPFRRLGFAAWRAGLPSGRPRLPERRGRYTLPEVTLLRRYGAPSEVVDLEIADGVIETIRPPGTPRDNAPPAQVLEAWRGMVVSPALADMHFHLPPDNILRLTDLSLLQVLRHGITTLRDAGDLDGTATPAALSRTLTGVLPGPDIHYAYAFVNAAPARWANSFAYDAPAQAPAIVARLRALGARCVKSYENLDAPRIAALRAACAEAEMGLLGHVPYGLTLEAAGLPDSQHLLGVAHPSALARNHILDRMIDWRSVDAARLDQVRRALAEPGLAATPTIGVTHALLNLETHAAACDGPVARSVPRFYPEVIWHPEHGIAAYRGMTRAQFDMVRQAIEKKSRLVRMLHADGVALHLGSDTQQPFSAPGISLHAEITAFTDAGVPRAAALDLASHGAARGLGLADRGEVREGLRADLLVSARDPAAPGWSPAGELRAVIAGGVLLDCADLDRAIATELGRFETSFGALTARWLARFAMHRSARNFVS